MLRFFKKHLGHGPRAFLKPMIHAGVWTRFALVCAREKIFRQPQGEAPPEFEHHPRVEGGADIGVVGASSFVGLHLLDLARRDGWNPIAFSRNPKAKSSESDWRTFSASGVFGAGRIPVWIAVCPITALPQALPLLELAGVECLVAVSSTSRFTKKNSRDPRERILANNLEQAEATLKKWAAQKGVSLFVLRTTLIYDGVGDANIAAMARFIRKFQCLPVLFPADGLRQPLHAQDVAKACLSAIRLEKSQADYDLSGGETLTYLEMAGRIFDSLGIEQKFINIPRSLLRILEFAGYFLPARLQPPTGMFERMNADLVFDHGSAAQDLNFSPRTFEPRCSLRPVTSHLKQ